MQLSRRLVRVICSSVVVLRLLSWSCSSGLAYVTGSSVMMPADCSVWVEETKDCDYDVTSELVAASSSSSSDTPSNSDGGDPYRREVQLQVAPRGLSVRLTATWLRTVPLHASRRRGAAWFLYVPHDDMASRGPSARLAAKTRTAARFSCRSSGWPSTVAPSTDCSTHRVPQRRSCRSRFLAVRRCCERCTTRRRSRMTPR